MAHCERCGSLFSLAKIYDTSDEVDNKPIKRYKSNKPEVYEMPKGLDVMHHGFELSISSKSSGIAKYFLTFFSLFWNGIVGLFVMIALASRSYEILLFISIHLTIGICIGYYTLSLYLNKNKILVDRRGIKTTYGPLRYPFKKDHYIDSALINQIYCQKYVVATVNGTPRYAYKVRLRKNDAEVIDIMTDLKSYHHALYLEQQIERFLNLEDRPVEEEFSLN